MIKKREKTGFRNRSTALQKENSLTGVRQRRTLLEGMEFQETKIFTETIDRLSTPEDYADLQDTLRVSPWKGDIIPDTGGCRKLRWGTGGKGKSGGSRIIYYWYKGDELIFLLLAYPKSKKGNLTMKEKKMLHGIIKGAKK